MAKPVVFKSQPGLETGPLIAEWFRFIPCNCYEWFIIFFALCLTVVYKMKPKEERGKGKGKNLAN